MDTQTQIDRLIELAIVQRSELKQLVSELPQLREYLGAEIERTFEEAEPQIRTELEEFCRARATDEHAKTGAALAAKVEELSKQLEVTTAAKYSVLMAERAENANLLAKAEARIEDAASMLSHAVKEIVTDELSRFPRAGEIDQLRKEFAEPRGLNPRGRWMPDETYQRLDLVTINGDSFVSNIDGNRERPSRTAGDWTLSAARGNGGGGGGVTTMTDLVPVPSNGQLLIGNGSAFVNSTLTAGTGISISNGAGSITINATDGNITLDDGTAAAPSLNFTNEPTTGLFRASANVMGFAVNGVSRATMTTTGVTVTGTITPSGSLHAAAGSVSNPSLAFNADQNTGLYNIGADNIGVAAGGAKVLDIATTGLGVTGTLSVSGVATLGTGAILNTPASGTLTNATGLPISTGVSGLGTGVATFLATPSSANLLAAVTNETGTGALVFGTSPTLTTPISATLTAPAANNLTLAGGAGNSSVILTPAGTGGVGIGTTNTSGKLTVGDNPGTWVATNLASFHAGTDQNLQITTASGFATGTRLFSINDAGAVATPLEIWAGVVSISNSNLLIGTTSETGLTGAGGLKINSSTAGSSGAGALVVAGGLATGADSFFGGSRLLAQKDQNAPTRIQARNDNSGTSAQSQVSATLGDFTTYTAMGSLSAGFTTSGLFAANAGYIASNATAGLNIFTVGATSLTLGTNSTAALTLASGGAATFAGAVTVNGANFLIGGGSGSQTNPNIAWTFSSQTGIFFPGGTAIGFTQGASEAARFSSGNLLLGTTTNSSNGKLQLATHTTSAGGIGFGTDTSLYRTAAGDLTLDGVGGAESILRFRKSGTESLRVEINSGGGYVSAANALYLRTGGTTALTLDSSQNATFAGTVKSSVSAGSRTIQSTPTVTVAPDAVQNLVSQNYGFFLVNENVLTGSIAIIGFNSGGTYIVWQEGTNYSTTANTASKFNVYYSAGTQLVVQNKKASNATFNIINLAGGS